MAPVKNRPRAKQRPRLRRQKDSFDFGNKAVAAMTPDRMDTVRVKGIKPPMYTF